MARIPEAVRRPLRRVWYALFRHHPYYYLGALFWAAMGGEETERFQRVFELVRQAPLSLRAYSLRFYLDELYYGRYSGSTILPEPNRLRWSGPLAVAYHRETLQRYTQQPEEFERDYGTFLTRVQEALQEASFDYVVEIGCGNGLLIERLAAHGPASGTTFVGLDISRETIAWTRERWPGSRVEYHCCDTLQEFLGLRRPPSVLVLANGTMQLFTENELLNCLRWLVAAIPRGGVVVKDFTYPDGRVELHSRRAGGFTFFHNYEYLFAEAGLESLRTQVHEVRPNWKTVVVSAAWTRPAA
jgi:SAM-dependent methyltransferase